MNATENKDGTIIEIYVKPNSPQFGIGIDGDEIIVRCTEEPTRGKVNKELIREFTKLFHTQIELISGLTSKQKKLLIKNTNVNTVKQILVLK